MVNEPARIFPKDFSSLDDNALYSFLWWSRTKNCFANYPVFICLFIFRFKDTWRLKKMWHMKRKWSLLIIPCLIKKISNHKTEACWKLPTVVLSNLLTNLCFFILLEVINLKFWQHLCRKFGSLYNVFSILLSSSLHAREFLFLPLFAFRPLLLSANTSGTNVSANQTLSPTQTSRWIVNRKIRR